MPTGQAISFPSLSFKMEALYDGTLEGFFALLQDAIASGNVPDRIRRAHPKSQQRDSSPGLFSEAELGSSLVSGPEQEQKSKAAMEKLRSCSEEAYRDCLQAWMSEEAIETDIIRYAIGLLGSPNRSTVERLRTDRSFGPCQSVLRASQRFLREQDRLLGLLRFKPTREAYLLARCEPETFALPALAEPLKRRFGTTAWAVQDERRHLVLSCDGSHEPEFSAYDPENPPFSPPEGLVPDEYEALWQEYFHIITIDSRKNPELQKRLLPLRYWKYLPELQGR